MGYAWMPAASYLEAREDGGRMRGGAPRAVWQTLEIDPRLVSAKSAAQHLDQVGRPVHLVWNPLTGEIVQLISALRAGRRIGGHDRNGCTGPAATFAERGSSAGVGTEGRVCIQIAVVAYAWELFTDGPMTRLEPIISWLESWRVPAWWPAGRPSSFERAHLGQRSRRLWASGGHFGASQVPACSAVGPGAIDIGRLTDPGYRSPIGVPPPRTDPEPTWATARAVAPLRLAGAQLPAPAANGTVPLPTAPSPPMPPPGTRSPGTRSPVMPSAVSPSPVTPAPAAASAAGSPAASGLR